jgi:hypothetical protein
LRQSIAFKALTKIRVWLSEEAYISVELPHVFQFFCGHQN